MTREELIDAIWDNEDAWSCPKYNCDEPEEEGNTGECCKKCAENLLVEYEHQIKSEVIDDLYNRLDEGVCDICEYKDFENDCSKTCTHEVENAKKWLMRLKNDGNY